MPVVTKNVAVFGSTGSIGTNALDGIAASNGRLRVAALSAHGKLPQLLEQAQIFKPRWVVATDKKLAEQFDWADLPAGSELVLGPESLARVAAAPEVDVVLAAIVGSAGLQSTWAALEA